MPKRQNSNCSDDTHLSKKARAATQVEMISMMPIEMLLVLLSYCNIVEKRFLSYACRWLREFMINNRMIYYQLGQKDSNNYLLSHKFRVDFDRFPGQIYRGSFGQTYLRSFCFLDIDLELVINVSYLSRIHTLSLSGLHRVTDVSALGTGLVHTLALHCLVRVTDVSALGSVHTLTLSSLSGVTDVSALGSVHTLTLTSLPGVTDVSALVSVHTLTLRCLPEVTDVSALGLVHTLTLNNLPGVRDVSALGRVHKLLLSL